MLENDFSVYAELCANDFESTVRQSVHKIENYRGSYVFGMLMCYARDNAIPQIKGYKNIVDYADSEYKVSKSSLYRSMQIYTEFRSGNTIFEDIAIKYRCFTFSQLVEILAIPCEFRYLVKYSMSTREIRKLNKSLIADVDNDEENEIVAAPQLNEIYESEVLVITNEEYIKSLTGKMFVTLLDHSVDCVPHLFGCFVGEDCPYKVCSNCIKKFLQQPYEKRADCYLQRFDKADNVVEAE